MEYKQVILVRKDLKLSKGKMGAQVAHAAVEAALRADVSLMKAWRQTGMKKVVLGVKDEKELYRYLQDAKDNDVAQALITDAGKTEIAPGTVTCLAVGPDKEGLVDAITGDAKLL